MGTGRLLGDIKIFFWGKNVFSGQHSIFYPFSKVSGPGRCPKRSGTSFSSSLHYWTPQNLFLGPVLDQSCQICKISNFPSLLSPLSSDASPLPTPVLKTTFILYHSIHSTSPTTCKKNIFIFDFLSFFSFYFFANLGWLLANLGTKKKSVGRERNPSG